MIVTKDHTERTQQPACFTMHAQTNTPCQRNSCRYWLESSRHKNCTIIAAKEGPKTLEEVGQIFGLTRMRICQIESATKKKLRVMN